MPCTKNHLLSQMQVSYCNHFLTFLCQHLKAVASTQVFFFFSLNMEVCNMHGVEWAYLIYCKLQLIEPPPSHVLVIGPPTCKLKILHSVRSPSRFNPPLAFPILNLFYCNVLKVQFPVNEKPSSINMCSYSLF